ncbi:MAG TPA: pyridoxal 5'-phosphate synthase glutaminase subunit PdxT [Candidatus Polarisedimenticolaceae bacterium]|nr:pyridoxal 5'-phosphate synthase glutaminase subunit PdxT [Candidatus Polarisedimenticolaceae bacterium]
MIGVLALQGDFEAHARVLRRLGADVAEVRRARDLASLDALVLPGGESTTLLNLMEDEPWFPAIRELHGRGGALLGTCAGAILLARQVTSPSQPSLSLLDAVIERNAFGRQVDSFETTLFAPALGGALSGVFIRAPRFRALGPGVAVLASLEEEPVLVQEGRVIAGTFHPEIAGEGRLHRYFMDLAHAARPRYQAAAGR